MSKKIKIEIKNNEKLEFTLLEDAKIGDYISLSELTEVSFDTLKLNLEKKKEDIVLQIWESEKDRILASSEEFRKLNSKIFELEKENQKNKSDHVLELKSKIYEIQIEKDNIITELNSKLDSLEEINNQKIEKVRLEAETKGDREIDDLKSKINLLEQKLSSNKEQLNSDLKAKENEVELSISNKYNEEIHRLNLQILSLNKDMETTKEKLKLETDNALLLKESEIRNELGIKIKEYEDQVRELENRRNSLNIKELGEGLENWMQSEASNNLQLPNTTFKKVNETIENTKPDFIFNIYNESEVLLTSVTIEAKSESLNAKNKKRNEEHIEKLNSDRNKNNSEFALLVTELEKDKDEFIFKKVGQYKDMYMVRPRYFVPFLQLIYNLSQKQNEINDLAIDFKDKKEILNDFESFKTEIIETTMNKMVKKIDEINKQADNAINSLEKIKESARLLNNYTSTLENKFNKFKINKLVEKI